MPLVTVDTDRLVLGHSLTAPVYDTKGTLLIDGGAEITVELKARLAARGVSSVVVDASDVASRKPVRAKPRTKPTRKVAEFRGRMSVRNAGPPVADQIAVHGTAGYNSQRSRAMSLAKRRNVASVSHLVDSLALGQQVGETLASVGSSVMDDLRDDFDNALMVAIGDGDSDLAAHAVKVSTLGMAIGIEMGLDAENVRIVGIAGLVADIGMTRVRPELRNARRALTPAEILEVQRHAAHSVDAIEDIPDMPPLVKAVVYQVHERPDGSGYPRGRTANSIHPFAAILHVADTYTAMTSHRPDRPPMMSYAAIETLLRDARSGRVDANVVRALLSVLSLFPIGSHVELSDGSEARVLRGNHGDYTKPIVQRTTDTNGTPLAGEGEIIDLRESELKVMGAIPGNGESSVDMRVTGRRAVLV